MSDLQQRAEILCASTASDICNAVVAARMAVEPWGYVVAESEITAAVAIIANNGLTGSSAGRSLGEMMRRLLPFTTPQVDCSIARTIASISSPNEARISAGRVAACAISSLLDAGADTISSMEQRLLNGGSNA